MDHIIETKLDEADAYADAIQERLTHEEVFENIREVLKNCNES